MGLVPLALSSLALGTPMVHGPINLFRLGFTILGSSPLSTSRGSSTRISTTGVGGFIGFGLILVLGTGRVSTEVAVRATIKAGLPILVLPSATTGSGRGVLHL